MEQELDKIRLLYQDCKYDNGILTVYVREDICVVLDKELKECYAYDKKGNNYTNKLKDIINFVNKLDQHLSHKYCTILQYFSDNFYTIPGVNNNNTDINPNSNYLNYDGKNDFFWQMIKEKYNVNTERKLCIVTYGIKFLSNQPNYCQKIYNAGMLRLENKKGCELSMNYYMRQRGTCPLIQEQVRCSLLFTTLMESIIEDLEKYNYGCIGIVCIAGHHRSVACAEMLKNLYTNIECKHLTIHLSQEHK
jgi:RNase adaptor protein for sRNA GlmZ degradation